MKKTFAFISICATILLSACYQAPEINENKDVAFNLSSEVSISTSRATPSEAGVQYIYVYDNESLILTQTSADSDFGSPTLSLAYGSHDLTFISSVQAYPTAGKVKDTFGYHYTLNVTSTTKSQSIQLNRIVTKLQMQIDDAIPASASKVNISTKRYDEVDISTLRGNHEITTPASFNISSAVGETGVQINMFTFCEDLDNVYTNDVTVTFYNASDAVIQQHTISDVPFKTNRTTQLKGNWFGGSNSPTLTLNTDWENTEVVNI